VRPQSRSRMRVRTLRGVCCVRSRLARAAHVHNKMSGANRAASAAGHHARLSTDTRLLQQGRRSANRTGRRSACKQCTEQTLNIRCLCRTRWSLLEASHRPGDALSAAARPSPMLSYRDCAWLTTPKWPLHVRVWLPCVLVAAYAQPLRLFPPSSQLSGRGGLCRVTQPGPGCSGCA